MIQLMVQTIRNPLVTWEQLRQLRLTVTEAWMLVIITSALAAILAWIGTLLLPASAEVGGALGALSRSPISMAGVQLGAATLAAFLMAEVGRIFGGKGRFAEALLAVGWIEAIMIVLQAFQLVLTVILPPLGALVGLATVVIAAYLVVAMTMAVHGFRNPLFVVLGIIATVMLVSFLMTMVAASLGLMPEVPR